MYDQKETFEFDVIIIGAGIVGLAIAHGLMNQYENILIVEKESTFGRHVSSRNSEVIHSGFYYEPNSLKANLCVKGNKLLYDFSRKYKIDHRNCGKYIIATMKEDIHKLEHLMENGEMNGLEGLKLLTANEIKKREPLINSVGGLWIPSSGIIDSHGIMQKLEFLIQSNDAKIVYNTEVTDISWYDFRKEFIRNGGDGIYAAWKTVPDEPAFSAAKIGHGNIPIAKKIQKNLMQFTTNQLSEEERVSQSEALYKTIKYFK